ncbi:hypothetical protein GCM10007415_24630 [Parapedobacter pyrenivorans]|uniref:Uncharacterized protein n=1 Tax=Parapedobacter pyrenivorans TaxID=1305674 RepID=A0A917HVA5_9SPHI|nr:hypothetical protein [Parapedobacter pyrenivorans]GGG89525.1 hypothetical protein GCM10007415_24630 [Parapedobacter pyrenivorans]
MKNLKTALFGLAVALVLVSCKKDDGTPDPAADAEQYKVVVVNEGAIHDFTQEMYINVAGKEVLSAEINGTVWDDIAVLEGDESRMTTRYFSKESDVPSAATYKTTNELYYMRYGARIQPKDGTESTMQTKIILYRAGERIGEKNYVISGKGGEFVVDYHDNYNLFDWDSYQPF